jgi:hypothetical protein
MFMAHSIGNREDGLLFASSDRKSSDLFLALPEEHRKHHPRVRRIHQVRDNYAIHSSRRVKEFLRESGDGFRLHFSPPDSPEHDAIEPLWRDLHGNVTRNHRCKTMDELLRRVLWCLHRVASQLRNTGSIHSARIEFHKAGSP